MLRSATSIIAIGLAALCSSHAGACDRPGTPTNVTARVISQFPPMIQVNWINTASETVHWDIEMTDGNGAIARTMPAGMPPVVTGRGTPVSNTFTVEPGVTRCFRIKARTGPGTQGCVSKQFSNRACATTSINPGPFHHGTDTCKPGFVWREATPSDHVCVTPTRRTEVQRENAMAAQRRQQGGGAFGPDTCRSGFVWRDAVAGDRVCVSPAKRAQAQRDNFLAAQRRVRG